MSEETMPPFDGETENDALPDEAAQDKADKSSVARQDDNPPPMNPPARDPMDQTVPDVATGSTPLTRRDD
ncbi:MAG TPA: hypothetical protein VGB77_10430 [Abditibacteriaceae bacterium]|jgi:hypothetical protein